MSNPVSSAHLFGEVVQLVIDCKQCRGPLKDAKALEQMLVEAAERVGATVLRTARCDYVPHGVTLMAFLAESHLLVSTWPETDFAVCEIMLCNDSMDPSDAWDVVKDVLHPRQAEIVRISHRQEPNFAPSVTAVSIPHDP